LLATVIDRVADALVAPLLSVATAFRTYVPAGTLLQVTLYGLVVSVPMTVVPAEKVTCVTDPSVSDAVALMTMLAGASNVAPFAGAVNATVGLALTLAVRAGDVVEAPPLSVATAVSEYAPAATLLHVMLYGAVLDVPMSVDPA
jgi:hypothetical protein